jgi:hypothetical protein
MVKIAFRFRRGLPNRVAIRVINVCREPKSENSTGCIPFFATPSFPRK